MVEFRGLRTTSSERQDLASQIERIFCYKTTSFQFSNGLVVKCPKNKSKKTISSLRKEFGSKSRYCSLKARKAYLYYIPEYLERFSSSHISGFEHFVLSGARKILGCVGLGNGSLWNLEDIRSDTANKTTKGQGINLGIIDTGIDYSHKELKKRFNNSKGYDFVDNNSDPMDENGHGTHVAGIAAGSSTGVAPSATLYAVRVLNRFGVGSEANIIYAIEWCINNGIDVINMSLGSSYRSILEEEACRAALQKGILIAAAAGNSGYGPNYPAAIDGVTAVAAVDRNNEHANFSNIWGTNDVSAPGVEIYSCYPDGYKKLSGTSMACPHIAGVAALGFSLSNLSNKRLEAIIKETAEKIGDTDDPDYEDIYGSGLVRADNVVRYLDR